ncbi:MAG: ParB N-terminal domain-containing protein [Actinobacteria bacterium]|nr:ParB N-terminal domain-containing protein [Actinomycetota bacterium]
MTEATTQDLELVHANPVDLVLDVNVRTIIDLDAEFLNSIGEHGVLQPPTGWRDERGVIHIEIGQRRSLAAAQKKLPTIPVIVKPRADAEAEKMLTQLVENDRRQGLRDSEHAAAYQQLTLFGLKPDDIAKRTGTKRDTVRAAVKILKEQPEALEVMKEHPVTLDVAAQIVEFNEHRDLVDRLTEVAEKTPERLAHEIGYAREEVEARAEVEQLRAECVNTYPDAKFIAPGDAWENFLTDLEVGEHEDEDSVLPELSELRIGSATEAPTPAEAMQRGGLVITPVDLRYWERREGEYAGKNYKLEFYVEHPLDRGYQFPNEDDAPELSPEALEQKQKAEELLRERQRVNEAWESANKIRRSWIADELLHDRRKLPAGTGFIVIAAWNKGGGPLPAWSSGESREFEHTTFFLGLQFDSKAWPAGTSYWADKDVIEQSVTRLANAAAGLGPDRVLLALALGKVEAQLDARGSHAKKWGAQYFELLQSWGYGLSEIEEQAIRDRQAELEAELAAQAAIRAETEDETDDFDDDSAEDDFDDDTDEDDVDDADED